MSVRHHHDSHVLQSIPFWNGLEASGLLSRGWCRPGGTYEEQCVWSSIAFRDSCHL